MSKDQDEIIVDDVINTLRLGQEKLLKLSSQDIEVLATNLKGKEKILQQKGYGYLSQFAENYSKEKYLETSVAATISNSITDTPEILAQKIVKGEYRSLTAQKPMMTPYPLLVNVDKTRNIYQQGSDADRASEGAKAFLEANGINKEKQEEIVNRLSSSTPAVRGILTKLGDRTVNQDKTALIGHGNAQSELGQSYAETWQEIQEVKRNTENEVLAFANGTKKFEEIKPTLQKHNDRVLEVRDVITRETSDIMKNHNTSEFQNAKTAAQQAFEQGKQASRNKELLSQKEVQNLLAMDPKAAARKLDSKEGKAFAELVKSGQLEKAISSAHPLKEPLKSLKAEIESREKKSSIGKWFSDLGNKIKNAFKNNSISKEALAKISDLSQKITAEEIRKPTSKESNIIQHQEPGQEVKRSPNIEGAQSLRNSLVANIDSPTRPSTPMPTPNNNNRRSSNIGR